MSDPVFPDPLRTGLRTVVENTLAGVNVGVNPIRGHQIQIAETTLTYDAGLET